MTITESCLHDGITDGLLDPNGLFNVLGPTEHTVEVAACAYSYLIVFRLWLFILIYCLL